MKNIKPLLILLTMLIASESFGQFAPRSIVDSSATGITEIITSDLNNDNFPDIIVSQKYPQNNKVSYYLNLGDGSFGNSQTIGSNIYYPLGVAAADFDGNGWNDVVTFSGLSNSGDLVLYKNVSGALSSQIVIDSNLYHAQSVKAEDLDNDGDIDIVLIIDISLIIYYNDGSGNFTKSIVPAGVITEYYALEVHDIDNDSFKDIVVGGSKTLIYKNTAGVISYDSVRTSVIPDNNHLVFLLHINDFDNDGDLDLVVDKQSLDILKWYSNDGAGNFSSPISIDSNANQCFSITSGDFDSDGDLDLFTGLSQLGQLVWYQNDGTGAFSSPNLVYQGSSPYTTEVFSDDLNNDGVTDIIWSEELSVHLNTTAGLNNELGSFEKADLVYPNPVSNSLNINVQKEESTLTIYNGLGQTVLSNYSLMAGTNKIDLNLRPGIYVVIITNEHEVMRQKIIVE